MSPTEPVTGVGKGKETHMWVFDGEEWTNEGGSTSEKTGPATIQAPRREEVYPALQIMEIVPTPRVRDTVFPIPTPSVDRKPR